MKYYFAIDSNNRLIGYNIVPQTNLPLFIDTDIVITEDANHYIFESNEIIFKPNLSMAREQAKKKCLNKFNLYQEVLFKDEAVEIKLYSAMREELNRYARDIDMPTPTVDQLANGIGVEDKHRFRLEMKEKILHHDLALADLLAQKIKMFKLIDECDDGEIILSMEFNFSWLSYSNMRWR